MRLTKSESVSLIVYVSLFHFGPSVSQKKVHIFKGKNENKFVY